MSKRRKKKEPKEYKRFETYNTDRYALYANLPSPPYAAHFFITVDGNFATNGDVELTPEEALRVGKWLVEFYSQSE